MTHIWTVPPLGNMNSPFVKVSSIDGMREWIVHDVSHDKWLLRYDTLINGKQFTATDESEAEPLELERFRAKAKLCINDLLRAA